MTEYKYEFDVTASAYASAIGQLQLAVNPGEKWLCAYAECGAMSNTGNLKLAIDHAFKDASATGATSDCVNICSFTALADSNRKQTIFPVFSNTQLLPYLRMKYAFENTGSSLATVKSIAIKLLTGEL